MRKRLLVFFALVMTLPGVAATTTAERLLSATVPIVDEASAIRALADELLQRLGIRDPQVASRGGRRVWYTGKAWFYFRSSDPVDRNEYSLTFRYRPSGTSLGLATWRGFPSTPTERALLYVTNETTGRTLLTLRQVDGRMVRLSGTEPGTLDELIARDEIGSKSDPLLELNDVDGFSAISDWTLLPCGDDGVKASSPPSALRSEST